MKKFSILLLLALTILSGCSGAENIKDNKPSYIDISIEQDGQPVEIVDNIAEIRKSPFTIIVKLKSGDGILVNSSFSPDSFNNAKMGLPIDEISGFTETGIAEELFNINSTVFVSKNSPNFWYYSSETDHRFSSVTTEGETVICRRKIDSLTNIDSGNSRTELLQLNEDAMYFVIMKIEWNQDYTKRIELERKIFIIKFTI